MKLGYSMAVGLLMACLCTIDYNFAITSKRTVERSCKCDACTCNPCSCKTCTGDCCAKKGKEDFRKAMRQLWNDHGTWTREYVVAALADLPSVDLAAKRLLKNQDDIGNALVPFYGASAGKKLAEMLKEHILIAVDVVKAAQKNDTKALKIADAKWHKNATDISKFLSSANQNIKFAQMQAMLFEHLRLLTDIVTSRLKKSWGDDITFYDSYRNQLNEMADELANAIINALPEKFK